MSYGQNSIVAIAMQNSFGTAADVSSAFYVPFISESLKKMIPPMYSEAMRGVFDEGDTYEGPHAVEGDVETELDAVSLGALLATCMELTGTVNSDSLYTHTFKPRTSDYDSKYSAERPCTVFVDRDAASRSLKYFDLNGNTLELGFANGEFLKAKVAFAGGQVNSHGSLTASFPTSKKMTWDQSSASIDGSASDIIANMTLTLENGLEAQHTLDGTQTPNRIKRQSMRTLAVDGTLKFDDYDEYDAFVAQSERPLVLTTVGTTEVQSGYNETVIVKLPAMRYEDASPNAGGPGQLEYALTARGKYSVSSATAIEIVVQNGQATY